MAPQDTKQSHDLLPRTRYEDDLYTWVLEQVALLNEGKLSEIDAANVAEELADVGKSEYYKLQSAISVLTQHLLKWDYQTTGRSPSWVATIKVQRKHIGHVIADNPGLKSHVEKAMARGYEIGKELAVGETGLDESTFPSECPYAFEDMMNREIKFDR
jgi:hypothetical protein